MHGRLIPLLVVSLLLATAVLVLLLVARRPDAEKGSVGNLLATVGATIELPDDARVLRARESGGKLLTALISSTEDRLRIRVSEGIDRAQALKLVRESRAMIDNLFADRQAPYPGQLSHTLRCPERFLPAEVVAKGNALVMLRLFANGRLAFGGCSEDLLRYRATVAFFYDEPRERLFRVDYFAAKERTSDPGADVLRSFRTGAGAEES